MHDSNNANNLVRAITVQSAASPLSSYATHASYNSPNFVNPPQPGLATDLTSALQTSIRINNSVQNILHRLRGPSPEATNKDKGPTAITFSAAFMDLLHSLNSTEGLLLEIETTLGSL